MKRFSFLLLFSISFLCSHAQLMSVSGNVKKIFDLQYPNAKEVDWTAGLDNDVVQFRLDTKKLKASFTKKGSWNWTESKVVIDSIPKQVQKGFKDCKYKDWRVKDCFEVIKPRSVANEYKIVVQKSMINKRVLVFDAKGRLYEQLHTL
jgi:Putative beta-lactamase-inhibitor-like, PepSY-like